MGETTMTRRRRRWPVWFLFCGLTVVLLLVAVQLILVWLAREAFYQQLREAKAEGLYQTAGTPVPIPDEENASSLLQQAIGSLSSIGQWRAPGLEPFSSWVPNPAQEKKAALAARPILDASGAALDLVHQAAKRRACRPISDSIRFRIAQPMEILKLEARTAIVRNDAPVAYRDIAEMLRISDFMQEEACDLSEWWSAVSLRSLACNVLRRALQADLPDEATLAALARALDGTDRPEALARAFWFGKEAPEVGMRRFRDGDLSRFSGNTLSSHVDLWLYQHAGWPSYRDWAEWMRLARKAAACARLPYHSAVAEIAAIEKRMSELPGWYLMSRHNYLASWLNSQATDHALHEGARIAVALARFRVAHGRWPDSLDALVPEFLPSLPLDPFTGKSFVYRKAGDSSRVYSLGSGQVDRGGGRVGQEGSNWNILFPLGDQEPFLGR